MMTCNGYKGWSSSGSLYPFASELLPYLFNMLHFTCEQLNDIAAARSPSVPFSVVVLKEYRQEQTMQPQRNPPAQRNAILWRHSQDVWFEVLFTHGTLRILVQNSWSLFLFSLCLNTRQITALATAQS